jgi:hypothetical protein
MNSDKTQGVSVLKKLINELIPKEVSVLLIAGNNSGYITLTDEDCSWIEQLCRASLLIDDEYFPKSDTQFAFDFLYLQSYIIRTYLLRCHINYRQIAQKYQCYVRQIQNTNTTTAAEILDLYGNYGMLLDEQQLETHWSHLKQMFLDKLYHGHNFLRQITTILKHHPDDLSSKGLYEFVESGTGENNYLQEQLKRHEIKDFQLCYIDHVRQLYEKSIEGFQYLFTDVPHLLHTVIDEQSNNELTQMFQSTLNLNNENLQITEIQSTVQRITEFLNELKTIENTLLQRSTQSLREICEYVAVKNPILSLIPDAIKCEHYVSLNIYFIQLRSVLQERTINIQEKETKLWSEKFHLQSDNQQQNREGNRYQGYLNSKINTDEDQNSVKNDEWPFPSIENDNMPTTGINKEFDIIDQELESEHRLESVRKTEEATTVDYKSLFKLSTQFVPLTASKLVQQVHEQEHHILSAISTKAQKYTVKHPDGKNGLHMCTSEKLFENLRRIFDDKKYDLNTFVVIDQNEIAVNFINNGNQAPLRILPEYSIIERSHLIELQFQFGTKLLKYSTTSTCDILTIINRFIDDKQLELTSPDFRLCFFDELGKSIDCKTVGDIYRSENNSIVNILVKEDNITSVLSEVIVRFKEGKLKVYFIVQIIDYSV